MTRETIIDELRKRGYDAEAYDNVKNGVTLAGIIIKTDKNVAPVIYVDEIIKDAENRILNKTVDFIIDRYKDAISERKENTAWEIAAKATKMLSDRDFIMKNVYIGLQKDSNEDIIKRPCGLEGIESYMYVILDSNDNGNCSVKLKKEILNNANVPEETVWEVAEFNTFSDTIIKPITDIMPEKDRMPGMDEALGMYVISNRLMRRGASAILNKPALHEFGKLLNTDKIIVIPSSVHEMIILAYDDAFDMNEISETVKIINASQVDPTERLTDRAYMIQL
jgi:hypothetical protein